MGMLVSLLFIALQLQHAGMVTEFHSIVLLLLVFLSWTWILLCFSRFAKRFGHGSSSGVLELLSNAFELSWPGVILMHLVVVIAMVCPWLLVQHVLVGESVEEGWPIFFIFGLSSFTLGLIRGRLQKPLLEQIRQTFCMDAGINIRDVEKTWDLDQLHRLCPGLLAVLFSLYNA